MTGGWLISTSGSPLRDGEDGITSDNSFVKGNRMGMLLDCSRGALRFVKNGVSGAGMSGWGGAGVPAGSRFLVSLSQASLLTTCSYPQPTKKNKPRP
jgi:hypothetical protein